MLGVPSQWQTNKCQKLWRMLTVPFQWQTKNSIYNITNVNDTQDSWSNNTSVIRHIFTRKIHNAETHLVFLPWHWKVDTLAATATDTNTPLTLARNWRQSLFGGSVASVRQLRHIPREGQPAHCCYNQYYSYNLPLLLCSLWVTYDCRGYGARVSHNVAWRESRSRLLSIWLMVQESTIRLREESHALGCSQ